MISVVVVDDQALVRASFALLLRTAPDIEVVGEASDGLEARRIVGREKPDVVLMDIRMPRMDGLEATRIILAECSPAPRVLVLTTFDHDEYVFEALRAGASGFLVKDAEPATLLDAIRTVARGDALLAPRATRRLIEEFLTRPHGQHRAPTGEPPVPVTQRELEVLLAIARGLHNEEIGRELHMSYATVKTHVAHLLEKTGARDRTQLVIYAYEHDLVP